MTTPSIEYVDTGRAKWLLGWTGALFVASLYRAVRGHPNDWMWWTLLAGIGGSSIATIVHGSRWQKPITVVSYVALAATCVGIAFGLWP